MNLLDAIGILSSGVGTGDWSGSHNGHKTISDVTGRVGLRDGTTLWADFKFKEEIGGVKKDHELKGERALTGGSSSVTLDGTAVAGSHLAFHLHVLGPIPHVRLEVDFVLKVSPQDQYRFDADVKPA